jgi:hypothetical protein
MQPDSLATSGPPFRIGWKEFVDFPEWQLRGIKVKIDTGARTSALDVNRYELLPTAEGGVIAELRLALDRRCPDLLTVVRTPVLLMVTVCNSSGVREERPLIETSLRLGPVTKRVQLTIANRACMRFPIILGRKALEGDFVIDVSQKYLMGRLHKAGRRSGARKRAEGESAL